MTAMLALMSGAGLRCCEVARLRWSDVDMIDGTIHVTGKGNKERVLEVGPAVRRSLAAIDHPGPFVFVNRGGRPYTPCRVSQLVNEHLRKCAAGCTAHQLRHRFATRALSEAAGDITIVRDLLGHSTVAVTEIYAAVTPGLAGTVARSIDVPGMC
jgi:site-specific recombinase XerD